MSIKPGALRFNTDSMKLEIFRGSANYEGSASMAGIGTLAAGQWEEIVATSPQAQTGGTRGVFGGGNGNVINYVTISTTGNALDFGDFTSSTRSQSASCSSRTRGVFGGGTDPAIVNTISYVTISSTGDAQDFGDLTVARRRLSSCSSSTRGVFGGGQTPTVVNPIDFITISSTGNALDFGDLIDVNRELAACSSSTRGVFGGGVQPEEFLVED
jgi:hypothetical protein